MKILITGGAGFIGSRLGHFLNRKGHQIILLDNLKYGYIHNISGNKDLERNFICMDIRDNSIEKFFEDVDIVFHIAGFISLPGCNDNPGEAFSVNTAGTANVLEMARRAGVRRVIFASTSALYEKETNLPFDEIPNPQPSLMYALSKKTAEEICNSFRELYKMDIVILRFFNVYGPGMDYRPPSYLISYLIGCLMKKERPILHSNGKQSRDMVFVSDVVRLCEIVMTHINAKNEVFNVGTGKTTSVQEMFNIIASVMRIKNIQPVYRDPKLVWEKFPKQFEGKYPIKPIFIENEVNKFTQASTEKSKKLLGWQAKVDINEGLKKTVNYVLKQKVWKI